MDGRRTQITLTTRQHAFLRDMSTRTGLPMAELIRRAIDQVFREKAKPQRRGIQWTFAVYRDPDAAVVARRTAPPKPRLYDDIR